MFIDSLMMKYRTLRENLMSNCDGSYVNVLLLMDRKYRTLRRIWYLIVWSLFSSFLLVFKESIGLWGESGLELTHLLCSLVHSLLRSIGLWWRIWISIGMIYSMCSTSVWSPSIGLWGESKYKNVCCSLHVLFTLMWEV
jgi:hypothetical protein